MNLYKCNKKSGPTINVQSSKTVTAGTSQKTVTPDTGYDAMGQVVVNPTPSTPITPSSSGTQFSAGLNNMSSSGWAYSSQPSTGTIKYKSLVNPVADNTTHSFTLSDADYNLISSGKAIIIIGMIQYSAGQGSYGGQVGIGLSQSSQYLNVIDSSNIGTSKTIYYIFQLSGVGTSGSGYIRLVYIQ